MRILVINQYYPPDVANSAKMLGHLVEALQHQHEVTVIAGRPSYNATASEGTPPGHVIRIPSTSFRRQLIAGRIANYFSYMALSSLRTMLCRRPDLVLTMTDPPVIGLLGVAAAARFRCPLVQVSHDVYPEIAEALGVITNQRAIAVWRKLNNFVRTRAAGVVVVGRDMEHLLAEQGVSRQKLHYVPMWAEDQILSTEQRERTRGIMSWNDRCVVMHAGNLGPAQDLDTLLDAAASLVDDPGFLFVLMGDGAARPHLEQRMKDEHLPNVRLIDYRPQDEAQELMAAADLHVVSLARGLGPLAAPSKTYGILAAGRPFIAAADSGAEPTLIVHEEDCGMSCTPGDGVALAKTIRELRSKPLDELGRNARDAFDRRFRRDVVTTKLVRVLEGVQRTSGSSQ